MRLSYLVQPLFTSEVVCSDLVTSFTLDWRTVFYRPCRRHMGLKEIILEKDVSLEEAKKLLEENSSSERLHLRKCTKLSYEDIISLIELINPELTSLTVNNCKYFDDKLVDKILDHCTRLSCITVSGNFKDLTNAGIGNLVKKCQELKSLSVLSCESDDVDDNDGEWALDDSVLSAIAEKGEISLEHFGLSGFKNVTSDGLRRFIKHISASLISLDLSELPAITDKLSQDIAKLCPKLTSINFGYCNLTDQGIGNFCSKCTLLQSVDLRGCNELTDESVFSLSEHCHSLKTIKLAWCLKITEKSLEALSRNCLDLEHVDIQHCSVKHIPYNFVKLSSLNELFVEGCTGLKCPSLEATMKGVAATKRFLEDSNLHCMCRVAFIGDEGSGKSSLSLCVVSSSLAVADSSTEGVSVTRWRPFSGHQDEAVNKDTLGMPVSEEWKDLTIEVWDCGGRKCIQGLHPLFFTDQTLYVLTFDINNPMEIKNMPNWLFLVQTKTPGCHMIVVGTHADGSSTDLSKISNQVLNTLKNAEKEHYLEVKAELDVLKTTDKQEDSFICARIERLEQLLNCRPQLPDKVLYVSSIKGQGISEVQNEIFRHLLDPSLFPHLTEKININLTYLYSEILRLREEKVVVIPWDQYLKLASESGITDPEEVRNATAVLECRGCITVFRIPARTQDLGPTQTVCVNPSVLLDCLACMHNETEPREFVPRFIKAGFLERYWPTNTKPNDWTLRSAIDDIVSKGLIREAVIPLCFQAVHLEEEEVLKILAFCRNIGVLVEGAPKGSYEVELVLAYYKNLSVFKRYFLPLQNKLPPETKTPEVWPSGVPEGHIQVGWRFKFPDAVSSNCSTLIIAACRNYKMSSDIYCYCQRCLVLKVGDVMVKISRDGSYLDMIGRSKILHGSKQALNMTWFILAQFFYVTDTLLLNYCGLSPEIMVPLYGCSRPKHKSLFELVKDYNVQPSHLANYRWFLPPGGLDAEEHTQIPSDTSTWLATIARKSTLFISYQSDHQDEVKLLRVNLEHSGFNCVGEWTLIGQGQELTENRRQSIMGSSLLLAFVTPDYLKWSRAQQDINLALDNHKPVIALLFDKTSWPVDNELETKLKSHAICLDFDAGCGEALSHQYDQGQLTKLVSQCNGILYGTGDIHPPEPPISPDSTFHIQNESNLGILHLQSSPQNQKEDTRKTSLVNHEKSKDPEKQGEKLHFSKPHIVDIVEPGESEETQVQRMAASAVAAAVAGATAQHISKADNSPEAVKAAAAAAEVAQAVVDGNSDAAAKGVVKVAKIVEESSRNHSHSKHMSNGSVSTPPRSSTCNIL